MIDYDKLKEAHELCQGTENLWLAVFLGDPRIFIRLYDELDDEYEVRYRPDDIDDLITKLRELTKPEPKYEKGDTVYWAFGDVIYYGEFEYVDGSDHYQVISADGSNLVSLDEKHLHPTREALIKSQIEYWHGLLFPEDLRNDPGTKLKPFHGNVSCARPAENIELGMGSRFKTTTGCASGPFGDACARPDDTHKKVEECVHEPSEYGRTSGPDKIHETLCKKCREFYR